MQKYGFVYLWFDRKHKRYYLGRHWGTETDGYICSSNRMRDAYYRRPEDFKRRILKLIFTSKEDLVIEEQKWLNLIKPEECNIKYYNKTLKATTPSTKGYNHTQETKIKISLGNIGKIRSEQTKEKLRIANKKQFDDNEHLLNHKNKSLELWKNEEYLTKQKIARKKPGFYKGFNKKHTEETKIKISLAKKGQTISSESKEKLSKYFSNSMWINNGVVNKRIPKNQLIPDGFILGRFKGIIL